MIQLYFVQFKYPGEGRSVAWHTISGANGCLWKGGRERACNKITEIGDKNKGFRFRIKPVKTVRRTD